MRLTLLALALWSGSSWQRPGTWALWEDCDAQADEDSQIGPDWDVLAQPAPDYEVDQRINW